MGSEVDTDLFCEEGQDGEDDERHEDAVGPELQLVPVHPPEKQHVSVSMKTCNISAEVRRVMQQEGSVWRASGQQGDKFEGRSYLDDQNSLKTSTSPVIFWIYHDLHR